MKKILIACGSGIATSTVAKQKISTYLDENGATTVVSGAVGCPVLAGLPLLTGMGVDKLYASVKAEMDK